MPRPAEVLSLSAADEVDRIRVDRCWNASPMPTPSASSATPPRISVSGPVCTGADGEGKAERGEQQHDGRGHDGDADAVAEPAEEMMAEMLQPAATNAVM